MAAKRLRDDSSDRDSDRDSADQPGEKRVRRVPSFRTVIKEAVMVNYAKNFFEAFQPMLRRAVAEEVERVLIHQTAGRQILQRSSQMLIQPAVEESSLQLVFRQPVQLPIFTGSKIEDVEGGSLQLHLIDTSTGSTSPVQFPTPLRIEILVIDGDFPGDREDWTTEEFTAKITKERNGKRPLIVGDINVTLRDGVATIDELQFTDNSSWIKSRHFRIAARVEPGSYEGPRIKEAMTDRFTVKDHRGELYKKHYPPALKDEVWRLERIGKDGAFHKKLAAHGINSVQDFLKLSVIDPGQLRKILGVNMSDKMWEGTLRHARTCLLGGKRYVHRVQQCTLILNPICEVVGLNYNGTEFHTSQLNMQLKTYVSQMVLDAYKNWNQLEEIIAMNNNNNSNATEKEQVHPQRQREVERQSWIAANSGDQGSGASSGFHTGEIDQEVHINNILSSTASSFDWSSPMIFDPTVSEDDYKSHYKFT